jgi:hypothetical protein
MTDTLLACPHCNQSLEIPDEMLGETVECPACGGSIQLPKATSATLPKKKVAARNRRIHTQATSSSATHQRTKGKTDRKRSLVPAISLGTVALLVILGGVFYLLSADRRNMKATGNKVRSQVEETAEHPCTLTLSPIKTAKGTALAALEFKWSKGATGMKKGDMTVVVLFQPKLIAPLKAELLALSRNYSFNLPNDDLMKMTSGLSIKDEKGNAYSGALILFFAGNDSKVDFRKSRKQTIPIRIQSENRWAGEPAIKGKGVLSFALFEEADPEHDHMKSTKYKQLSNVVSQEVDLK